jgi:flagellin
MAQTINTNVMSLNAQRNLSASQSSLAISMQRLSSGLRVNSAKDDAAGLAIAERMNTQVRGANVSMRNANDGISLLQTAEGALGKIGENLQRIRELAVQSANGTMVDSDRLYLQAEATELQKEIVRVVDNTKYNGVLLFNGSIPDPVTFQIGPDPTDIVDVATTNFNMQSLAAFAAADISTVAGAQAVMTAVDADLGIVNTARATTGAVQSRFEAIIGQLQVFTENTSAARGRIMDADFAQETSNLSRAQILQQAGTSMVAQANALPQQVLKLLQQ